MLPEPQPPQELRVARVGTQRVQPTNRPQNGQPPYGPLLSLEPGERRVLIAEQRVSHSDLHPLIPRVRMLLQLPDEPPGSRLVAAEPAQHGLASGHGQGARREVPRRLELGTRSGT